MAPHTASEPFLGYKSYIVPDSCRIPIPGHLVLLAGDPFHQSCVEVVFASCRDTSCLPLIGDARSRAWPGTSETACPALGIKLITSSWIFVSFSLKPGRTSSESGTNREFFARSATSEARSMASNRRKKISANMAASSCVKQYRAGRFFRLVPTMTGTSFTTLTAATLSRTTSASVEPGWITASDHFTLTPKMMAAFQAQGFGKLGHLSPPIRTLIISQRR